MKRIGADKFLSKEEMLEWNVLNTDEYVDIREDNLKFKCENCNEIYTTSLVIRKKQIHQTCKSCSHKRGGSIKRNGDSDLVEWNVLNPDEYKGTNSYNLKFKCETCKDEYTTSLHNRQHQKRQRCQKCTGMISNGELEVLDYIKSFYKDEIITSDRTQLSPKEIDIYLPDLKIGIEYNGYYWHSENLSSSNRYKHLDKYNLAKEKDIRLIFIDEDLWLNKNDRMKNYLKHQLGYSDSKRVYARKCVVKEITVNESRSFFNEYHIQGFRASNKYIGLYHSDVLVAIGSFSINGELLRYATSLNVIGGLGKVSKYYSINYQSIYTYCDLSLHDYQGYLKAGYKQTSKKPSRDYWYIVNGERYHRRYFQKKKIVKKFSDLSFDLDNQTELDMINQVNDEIQGMNILRIWGVGNVKLQFPTI